MFICTYKIINWSNLFVYTAISLQDYKLSCAGVSLQNEAE